MAKTLTGKVVSDKTDKTIVVAVHTHKTHPIYRKAYSVTRRFMAHDEKNEAKEGDMVVITECRPISARKRYKLTSITGHSVIAAADSVESVTAEVSAEEDK